MKLLPFNNDIEDLDLSDSEKQAILQDIRAEIQTIKSNRSDLEEKWEEEDELYEMIREETDFPWDGAFNITIPIIRADIDIVKNKAKNNIFVNPMMVARNVAGQNAPPELKTEHEEWINDKMLDVAGINIQQKVSPAILSALKHGVGWIKEYYFKNIETVQETKYYSIMDTDKYEEDFKDEKDSDLYKEYIQKLEKDGEIYVKIENERMNGSPIKIDCVNIRDLYVRLSPSDLNVHKLVAEKIKMTWYEINCWFDQDLYDKKVKDEIINSNPKYTHPDKDYEVWECIYRYEYKGSEIKTIITFLDLNGTELWLRGITFTYNHNKVYYIKYEILPKENSVYGYSAIDILKLLNKAIDELWNQTLNAGTLLNSPAFEVEESSGFDPTIKKWSPGVIWHVKKRGGITPLPLPQMREVTPYIDRILQSVEWAFGVSVYATGRESSLDPRAPASKAMMLLQESNLRISEYINNIQFSNIELFHIAISLFRQFYNDDTDIKVYNETKNISEQALFTEFSYIPQLSNITLNKALERESNMQMLMFLTDQPDIWSRPDARLFALKTVLTSFGDVWSRNIDTLLPTLEEMKQQQMLQQQQAQIQQLGGGELQPTMGSPDAMGGIRENIPREMIPNE